MEPAPPEQTADRTLEAPTVTPEAPRFVILAHQLTRTNARLLEAVRQLEVETAWIDDPVLAGPLDTVLARLDVLPTLDGVEDGLWALRRLEHDGVRILNCADTLLTCHDKLATALALARYGLPHPRTACVDDVERAPSFEPPYVVKPRFGSWGRDVYLCRTETELRERLAGLQERQWFVRHGAIVQELVPPVGHDLRLVVADGSVVGAIERVAAPGEWRTNVALGGHRERVDRISPRAVELALGAASAVRGDFVGVDLLPNGDDEWVVLEVNGAVELTEEYSLPGRSVFGSAAAALAASALAAAV